MTLTSSAEETDLEFTQQLMDMFYKARDYRRNRYDVWYRNYRLVNNRLGGTQATSWMPTPRDSEIYPTLSAIVAWMTDQRLNLSFTPASDPDSAFHDFILKVANDLTLLVQSLYHAQYTVAQIKLMIWDALTYGIGILKTVWDQSLDDGYGNACMKRLDPWNFYCDPIATSMDDAEYFVEVRMMTYDEIERRYPDSAHLIPGALTLGSDSVDARPDIYKSSNDGMINLAGIQGAQTRYGLPISSNSRYRGEVINVYEFWLKENEDSPVDDELYIEARWRVVVLAKNIILLDEYADELWSHKSHPFSRFVFDDIGEFYGISLVDHLAQPQIYINRLLTALQHNAELVGNPIFIESANSGLDRVGIVNRPGLRLRLNGPAAMQNRPDWLQPPQMPPSVTALVQFWISRIENTSGLSAIVRGATQQGQRREAQGVMSSMQEAAFVRIRSALANLEECLKNATSKLSDLIIDNYNDDRIVAIIGQDGEQTSLVLRGNHFMVPSSGGRTPLKYTLKVDAGSSSPTSRSARVAEADHLAALGAFDDIELLKYHEVPNYKSIVERKDSRVQAGLFNSPGARQRAQRQEQK